MRSDSGAEEESVDQASLGAAVCAERKVIPARRKFILCYYYKVRT